MPAEITDIADPVALRDHWRAGCWRGDSATELQALERWLDLSDQWAERARTSPASADRACWLAAAELERVARWPLIRLGRDGLVPDLARPALFAHAAGDPVEERLARQGVATDRLRAQATPELRNEVVSEAGRREGTPVQQARACLNAAWAARSTRGAESSQWGREGLATLGPVGPDDPRPLRELALHLLQQAGEFLPWAERSVMARSMLSLVQPGEHPAWRARILRRLWTAALENHAAEAPVLLGQAVDAAVVSGRGRSMMEVASGLISSVQFQDLTPGAAVGPLRRLALAADPRENPLAAMNVKSFLIEVLVSTGNDADAYSVGREALATLDDLRHGRIRPLTRAMTPSDWAMLWAGLAVNVATSAANLERFAEAAALADQAMQVHRAQGHNLVAATTALELATYRQGTGNTSQALDALTLAGDLAQAGDDRDLQARAIARGPQIVLERDGAPAALEACVLAERQIRQLAVDLQDPVEQGLVIWEALDVRRLQAEILADHGGHRKALDCLRGVPDEFLSHGYTTQASEVLVVSGHYHVALDEGDLAQADWQRAVELAGSGDDAWIRAKAVAVWTDWLTAHGQPERAQQIREQYDTSL